MNKPNEAIPIFEKLIDDETVDPKIWIYLGVAYYQIQEYEKSLELCVKGLSKQNTDHKVLAYNAGNSAYAMGRYARADACYAISMKDDSSYAPPVLNRANAQLRQDYLEEARDNYILYLQLNPETPQKENIELMIKKLEAELAWRANQKPELVVPDEFGSDGTPVSKPESGETLEKIDVEILTILHEGKTDFSTEEFGERVYEVPPALPAPLEAEKKPDGKTSGMSGSGEVSAEYVSEEKVAPNLPVERKKPSYGERLDGDEVVAPAIQEKKEERIPEEKVYNEPPAIDGGEKANSDF